MSDRRRKLLNEAVRKGLNSDELGKLMLLQEYQDRVDRGEIPDSIGTDYLFLLDLSVKSATEYESLFLDFATDFLELCRGKLPADNRGYLSQFRWYPAADGFVGYILDCCFSLFRNGDQDAKMLLREYARRVYRYEWNIIKRYQKITLTELIIDLNTDHDGVDDKETRSVYLVLAELAGIPIDGRSVGVFQFDTTQVYEDMKKDFFKEIDARVDVNVKAKEQMKKAIAEETRWAVYNKEGFSTNVTTALFRHYLGRFGYHFDPSYFAIGPDFRTEALYALCCEGIELDYITEEDWPWIVNTVRVLMPIVQEMFHRDEFNKITYNFGIIEDHKSLIPADYKKADAPSKEAPAVLQAVTEDVDREALLKSISDYQIKKRVDESIIQEQKIAIASLKSAEAENEVLKDELDSIRGELAALRNHVYQMQQEYKPVAEKTIDEMIETLKAKKVAIIGGHDHWIAKQTEILPKWTYITNKRVDTSPVEVVAGAEYVYFMASCLGHKTYYKWVDYLRRNHIPFGYISDVSREKNVRQFYDDLIKEPKQ